MEEEVVEEEVGQGQTPYMRRLRMMKKHDEQEIKHMKVKYTFSR